MKMKKCELLDFSSRTPLGTLKVLVQILKLIPVNTQLCEELRNVESAVEGHCPPGESCAGLPDCPCPLCCVDWPGEPCLYSDLSFASYPLPMGMVGVCLFDL